MVEFKISHYAERTGARSGLLELNNKKVETPLLWLGSLLDQSIKPWDFFTFNGVMLNAYEIMTDERILCKLDEGKTIHHLVGGQNLVMMDSGGFQLSKKDLSIDPTTILDIYNIAKPDIGVILDYPLNPSALSKRKSRWQKTLKNTEYMLNNAQDIALMPVVHGYSLKEIQKACKALKKLSNPPLVGIGSIVPLLRSIKTSNLSKLNGDCNNFKLMIKIVSIVREEFPESFLHVFGVGSASTMHLMFSLGVDSVDSMSWRMKAAYGAIQLPGLSDRFIVSKNRKKGRVQLTEFKLLQDCECPLCKRCKNIEEQKSLYDNTLDYTFVNRAMHNAYVLKLEEKSFREALIQDSVIEFFKERSEKNRMYKLFMNYLQEIKMY